MEPADPPMRYLSLAIASLQGERASRRDDLFGNVLTAINLARRTAITAFEEFHLPSAYKLVTTISLPPHGTSLHCLVEVVLPDRTDSMTVAIRRREDVQDMIIAINLFAQRARRSFESQN